jgi:phosphoribosyl 1,2-cyclic phosphodiesterase
MACRCVNSTDVTQPRVKLLGHLAHTSLFVKCARLDCADVTQLLTDFGVTLTDVTQLLTDFGVTLRTHLLSWHVGLSIQQMSHNLVSNF